MRFTKLRRHASLRVIDSANVHGGQMRTRTCITRERKISRLFYRADQLFRDAIAFECFKPPVRDQELKQLAVN